MRPIVTAVPHDVPMGGAIQASARMLDASEVVRFKATAGRVIALRTAFVVGDGAPRSWIHCAVFGMWKGYRDGTIVFDRGFFGAVVANFGARTTPPPLTYEHPRYDGAGMPIPAAGFIHELALRDDGLWALVEWTPGGAGYVRAGEYRYCSVVIDRKSVDPVSGEAVGPRLMEIGLTNQPFIDGLTPITLPGDTA